MNEEALTIRGARQAAHDLLRDLRSGDDLRIRRAAERLGRLRSFSDANAWPLERIVRAARLKHALAVIAEDRGYPSWTAFMHHHRAGILWYHRSMSFFVNRWFSTYHSARASRDAGGGYLIPSGRQFVVVDREAIRQCGLDPDDEDWAAVGWDVVRPLDRRALDRLIDRLLRAQDVA